MPQIAAPTIYRTPPEDIDELILDLQWRQNNRDIYYVVDASDIVEFCFPINPYKLAPPNIDTIAADQAAFHELFFEQDPPILLPQYAAELNRHLMFVMRNTARAYEEGQIADKLLSGVSMSQLMTSDDKTLLDAFQKHFTTYLAVAMGIYSVGGSRFNQILTTRLRKLADIPNETVKSMLENYQPLYVDQLFTFLADEIKARTSEPYKEQQQLRTAYTDAQAIDWLICANRALASAHQSGHLQRPAMFLYVSSAARTKRIFGSDLLQKLLPVIDGRPSSFWRQKNQILLSAICKPADATDLGRTIANLVRVREISSAIIDLERSIASPGDADWRALADRIRSVEAALKERKRPSYNLTLLTKVKMYRRFLEASPGSAGQREFLEQFKSVVSQHGIADLALRRLLDFEFLSQAQSQFAAAMLPQLTGNVSEATIAWLGERGSQLFRLGSPKLRPPYCDIASRALRYASRWSAAEGEGRRILLIQTVEAFLDLDQGANSIFDADHEFTRCLLYICFLGTAGEERAYEAAARVATLNPAYQHEFLFLQMLVALHVGRYLDAYEAARKGIASKTSDGRFYFGRASISFRWLCDTESYASCPVNAAAVVTDLRHAIRCFEESDSRPELVAAAYNNLAHCYSFSPTDTNLKTIYDLPNARLALEALKRVSPKEGWSPDHPEYLHTEAYLEFRECSASIMGGVEYPDLRYKVTAALRDISEAVKINPLPQYERTQSQLRKLALMVSRRTETK